MQQCSGSPESRGAFFPNVRVVGVSRPSVSEVMPLSEFLKKQTSGNWSTYRERGNKSVMCRDIDFIHSTLLGEVPVHPEQCTSDICALASKEWTVQTLITSNRTHAVTYRMLVDPKGEHRMVLRVDNPSFH